MLLVAKLCLALLQPHGLQLARLLRPLCPWAFPGKMLGVGSHFLLQGPSSPRDRTCQLLLGRPVLHHGATWEAHKPISSFLIVNAVNLEGKTCCRDGGDILVVSELETLELIEIV